VRVSLPSDDSDPSSTGDGYVQLEVGIDRRLARNAQFPTGACLTLKVIAGSGWLFSLGYTRRPIGA